MMDEPAPYGIDLGSDELQVLRGLAAGGVVELDEVMRTRLERLGYLVPAAAGDTPHQLPRLTAKGMMTAALVR